MKKKKERFRLNDTPEKGARLDFRVTEELRAKLEKHCRDKGKFLTVAVTEAIENYLETHKDT